MPSAQHRVTVIPGDGVGPEVVRAGVRVIEAARRSTTSTRRPSEKFGTHSTSLATASSCHVWMLPGAPRREP